MPGKTVLFVKGAPEIVFSLCATADVDKATLDAQLLAYQQRAMRTLGFAYQVVEDGDDTIADQRVTARRLHFIAIAAIADPVRAEVPDAVAWRAPTVAGTGTRNSLRKPRAETLRLE